MQESQVNCDKKMAPAAKGLYTPGVSPTLDHAVLRTAQEELAKAKRQEQKDREETVPAPR